MDPLHPLLQVILVSEGVRHTLEAVACHPLDLRAPSVREAHEGKRCFNIHIMLKLKMSQISVLCVHGNQIVKFRESESLSLRSEMQQKHRGL